MKEGGGGVCCVPTGTKGDSRGVVVGGGCCVPTGTKGDSMGGRGGVLDPLGDDDRGWT